MRDRRDALLLHDGSRAEQRACRNKPDIAKYALAHLVEDISAQHRRAAAAPRASRVDVLALVKDHHAAVAVAFAEIDPFLR